MREICAAAGRAIAVLLCPLLGACGVILGIEADPGVPLAEGGADAAMPTRSGDGGADASDGDGGSVTDACAMPATCAPELLTTMGGSVLRLVTAGSALYAAASGPAPSVFRIDLASPLVPLDLDPHGVIPQEFYGTSNIAVDPTGVVFWGTPNGLRRRDADAQPDAGDGAGLTTMTELGAPVSGVRIVDGRLHFTVTGPNAAAAPNNGHLASCALPSCAPDLQPVVNTPGPIDVIVVGMARWWLGTDTALQKLTFHSASGSIGGEQLSPSLMVTDGSRIFWSTADALRMFTIATSELVDLLPAGSTSRVNGIVLDTDGTLYVTQDKGVKRCAIASGKCAFTELARGASQAADIAVDSTFLYWGNLDGSILRLRKP